jgi:RHS repeat-associated protein
MTYPDGEVVTTSYNNQGLPDTLNGANSYVSATTYNAASQLDSLTFGNGAVTDYVHNANNLRLTDIVTTKSGNTLLNLHYAFDNVGNILSVQDNARGETTNYTYDDLSRLMTASVTNGPNQYSRSWTYDSIGNMQTRVEQGVTTTYSYDANHDHAVKQAGANYFCYDANGNMTKRNATSAACSNGDQLTYDVENHLTQVVKGATTTNFAYNGDGTRVKREVVGTGTTYYIGNYFEVYVPNSGTTTFNKYYYFSAQRVAAKIAGTLFYLQGDHLGSSSVVMTQAGTSFYTRQTYFPYGAQRTTEGSALPTDYTFTGQKNDDSTGLMFYGARYYDSALGRFTQPDTIVPSPLNRSPMNCIR